MANNRVSKEVRAEMVRRYTKDGQSIRGIANDLGRPYSTVRLHLELAEVEFRPLGNPAHISDDVHAEIVRRYTEDRQSVDGIAEDLAISSGIVYLQLGRADVEVRPPGISDDVHAEIVRRYTENGQSVDGIAEDLATTTATVYRHLKRAEVDLRTRRVRRNPDDVHAEIVRRYTRDRQSAQRIAEDLATSISTVYRHLKDASVVLRSRRVRDSPDPPLPPGAPPDPDDPLVEAAFRSTHRPATHIARASSYLQGPR